MPQPRYIGVDPGPAEHIFVATTDGWPLFAYEGHYPIEIQPTDVVVFEWPVPQGRPWGWDIHNTHEGIAVVRYRLWKQYKVPIYSVPSNTARRQVTGWGNEKFDKFCGQWLRAQGIMTGRGEMLSSPHRRDAFVMALWGLNCSKHPDSAKYLYRGENEQG